MTKRLLLSLALIGSVLILFTNCTSTSNEKEDEPTETFSFVEGHTPVWDLAIVSVLEIAETMPEDGFNFRPMDSVRTFAEQLMHIADGSVAISNLFLKDIKPSAPEPHDIANMTKADVMAYVKGKLETVGETIKTMSDQKLNEKIKSFAGNDMTRLEGLLLTHDHLTNHKAKANLYLRLNNLVPPGYKYY